MELRPRLVEEWKYERWQGPWSSAWTLWYFVLWRHVGNLFI